jgi:hypothetical protein
MDGAVVPDAWDHGANRLAKLEARRPCLGSVLGQQPIEQRDARRQLVNFVTLGIEGRFRGVREQANTRPDMVATRRMPSRTRSLVDESRCCSGSRRSRTPERSPSSTAQTMARSGEAQIASGFQWLARERQ